MFGRRAARKRRLAEPKLKRRRKSQREQVQLRETPLLTIRKIQGVSRSEVQSLSKLIRDDKKEEEKKKDKRKPSVSKDEKKKSTKAKSGSKKPGKAKDVSKKVKPKHEGQKKKVGKK